MVFRKKIPEETRAFVRFTANSKRWSVKEVLEKTHISRASLYRIRHKDSFQQRQPRNECQLERRKPGRPRKLTTREERLLLREIPRLRKEEGQFTVKRLMLQAGITALQVSNRTVQRFLRREGFQYLQARKKGVLLEGDLIKRKQFAKKMKKDYDQHVWQNSISFFLDGVSFIHKYNPLDQARAPKGRIWRKPREGLSYGCTAKGAHCGSGGRVAKFMVAVSYGKGVILCEQYETLNGRYFQSLVEREFPRMFTIADKEGRRFFLQDGDPSQNSALARAAWRKMGAKLLSIPPRSPDINCVENLFHIVKQLLEQDAIKYNIMFETYEQFSERVETTIRNLNTDIINKTIESMNNRMDLIIEKKGQRTKY